MNFEECLRATIQDSMVSALERMKTLNAEDRQALLVEHMENLCFDDEEILMVPHFDQGAT